MSSDFFGGRAFLLLAEVLKLRAAPLRNFGRGTGRFGRPWRGQCPAKLRAAPVALRPCAVPADERGGRGRDTGGSHSATLREGRQAPRSKNMRTWVARSTGSRLVHDVAGRQQGAEVRVGVPAQCSGGEWVSGMPPF